MNHKTVNGWILLSLLMSTLVFSYPQPQQTTSHIAAQYLPKNVHHADHQQQQYLRQQAIQPRIQHYQVASAQQQHHPQELQQQSVADRKFAEKPNALKKVSLDDIDEDIQTNQIQDNMFSWSNMIGSLMTMFFNNQNMMAPTKSDDPDVGNGIATSPWANVIAVCMYTYINCLTT